MRALENITYDELHVGDYATFTKSLTDEELVLFAAASGDVNPVSLDPEFASHSTFKQRIGHGMWSGSLISAALSTVIPGPGTIHLEQELKFKLPVKLGDTLTVKLTVKEKLERSRVLLDCEVLNQDDELVVSGQAKVIAPTDKVSLEQPTLPRITIEQ
ncbi:MAG: MaoC/PaaZ C-terminal domain-containing protein [Oleiphilaceae bacterium]|nr:MaoC/PaaZ C-terminal domain-containing protein [Oleiphilaceae bacterium]